MSSEFPQNQPKQKYVHSALLVDIGSGSQTFCQICFWLWGIGGLILCVPGFFGNFVSAVAAVPALLYWIGGMVLFGVGGLLAGSRFDFKRPVVE
jgi:hypothetical protein